MVREHTAAARERLIDAGLSPAEATLDARLLAQFVLGWDSARFITSSSERAPDDFVPQYHAVVERRMRREPIAYIVGEREFWGLTFDVSPAVLIPRPETELIVEWALEMLPDHAASLMVADVGTGSGCLAVALAHEYPSARVLATDIAAAALAVTRRNVIRHEMQDRIVVFEADLLPVESGLFDLIVSNPPYVPSVDLWTLPSDVRDYEPASALFAGPDGLSLIERLVTQAARHLVPSGLLLFEFGFGQADAVTALIAHTPGLTMISIQRDLQGIPRLAISRRIE